MSLINRGLFLALLSISAIASTQSELHLKASEQFKNRYWLNGMKRNLETAYYLEPGKSINVERLESGLSFISNTITSLLNESVGYTLFNKYFSENRFSSNADVLDYTQEINVYNSYYSLKSKWPSLFSALTEIDWGDSGPCEIDILINENCGRISKVSYVFSNMSSSQANSLRVLNEGVIDETNGLLKSGLNIDLSEHFFNLFQFYQYSDSIVTLLDTKVYNLGTNDVVKKSRFIELTRALLSQVFTERGGILLNSSQYEIDLDPSSCDQDCKVTYFKNLLISENNDISSEITDLIFDQKMIKTILNLYLSLDEAGKKLLKVNLYSYLSEIVGLDVFDSNLNHVLKDKVVNSLNYTTELLIQNNDVISLKLAKEIQLFLRSWGSDV
ncbi:hypothetical protein [Halobacteriovorax sp. RZ-2]|uniref:hypothetical protein n=1 Tax=unclassified Halobacteriovorax TaxID=2639665 RepID=UPI00371407E7